MQNRLESSEDKPRAIPESSTGDLSHRLNVRTPESIDPRSAMTARPLPTTEQLYEPPASREISRPLQTHRPQFSKSATAKGPLVLKELLVSDADLTPQMSKQGTKQNTPSFGHHTEEQRPTKSIRIFERTEDVHESSSSQSSPVYEVVSANIHDLQITKLRDWSCNMV